MVDRLLDALLHMILAVGVTLAFVAIVAAVGKLVGGGFTRVRASGITILRYGNYYRGLGVVLVVFFSSIGALSVVFDPELRLVWACFWGFWLLLGAWIFVEGFRKEIVLDDCGVNRRSWFGGLTTIPWFEIERIRNRGRPLGYFIVRGAGKSIWLSHYLEGLDDFKNECRQRLAAHVFGAELDKPLYRDYF